MSEFSYDSKDPEEILPLSQQLEARNLRNDCPFLEAGIDNFVDTDNVVVTLGISTDDEIIQSISRIIHNSSDSQYNVYSHHQRSK